MRVNDHQDDLPPWKANKMAWVFMKDLFEAGIVMPVID